MSKKNQDSENLWEFIQKGIEQVDITNRITNTSNKFISIGIKIDGLTRKTQIFISASSLIVSLVIISPLNILQKISFSPFIAIGFGSLVSICSKNTAEDERRIELDNLEKRLIKAIQEDQYDIVTHIKHRYKLVILATSEELPTLLYSLDKHHIQKNNES